MKCCYRCAGLCTAAAAATLAVADRLIAGTYVSMWIGSFVRAYTHKIHAQAPIYTQPALTLLPTFAVNVNSAAATQYFMAI